MRPHAGLADRLSQYQEEPDDSVWRGIAHRLSPPQPERRRLRATGVVLLFLGVVSPVVVEDSARSAFTVPASAGSDRSFTVPADAVPPGPVTDLPGLDDALAVKRPPSGLRAPAPRTADMMTGADADRASAQSAGSDTVVTETAEIPPGPVDVMQPGPRKGKAKPGARKLRIYFAVAPSLSFNDVTPAADDQWRVTELKSPSILSMRRLGVTAETGVQLSLNRRLSFHGGVRLYHQQQEIRFRYRDLHDTRISAAGDEWTFSGEPQFREGRLQYDMLNAGASAGLLYLIKNDGLRHSAGAGLGVQHGLLGGTRGYDNSRSLYVTYQLLYRVEYETTGGASIFVQPFVQRTAWSRETPAVLFSNKPYHAGITVGLVLR